MKIFKTILSVFLAVIIAIGGCGCMNSKLDLFKNESEIQAEKAEQMLYEKYGKEFVVDSLGARWGTATDMFYTCACHPVDDESFVFKATVSKDYSTLNDDYASIIVAKTLANGLERELSDIKTTKTIFVQFHDDTGIEKETMNLNYNELLRLDFAPIVNVIIGVTDDCLEELEGRMKELFKNYSCGASVRLYIMSVSQEKNFSDWKNANVYWDDDLNEILGATPNKEIEINF